MLQNLFSLATSAAKLGIDSNRAAKQEARARELINESKQVKKTPLRKEFEQAKRGADMMVTQGMPQTFTQQRLLDADAANQLKSISQSSPSGALSAAAIASVMGEKAKATLGIQAEEAKTRQGAAKAAIDRLWQVGEKERDLEVEQRQRREALQERAAELEDNALARRESSEGQFLKSATGAMTSMFSGGMGGAGGMGSIAGIGKGAGSSMMPSSGGGGAIGFNFAKGIENAASEDSSLRAQEKEIQDTGLESASTDDPYKPKESREEFLARVFGNKNRSLTTQDINNISAVRRLGIADDNVTDDEILDMLKDPKILQQINSFYKK